MGLSSVLNLEEGRPSLAQAILGGLTALAGATILAGLIAGFQHGARDDGAFCLQYLQAGLVEAGVYEGSRAVLRVDSVYAVEGMFLDIVQTTEPPVTEVTPDTMVSGDTLTWIWHVSPSSLQSMTATAGGCLLTLRDSTVFHANDVMKGWYPYIVPWRPSN